MEQYREEMKKAIEDAGRYVDDILKNLDGGRISGIDITLRIRPCEPIGVNIVLTSDGKLLSK